ncbi:hypothetical protein HDN1F_12610 [gamma proteobacterium HdN1]|nr:hypothetical protein HDN1F_12610 [gamma proteobacterium HdN1]
MSIVTDIKDWLSFEHLSKKDLNTLPEMGVGNPNHIPNPNDHTLMARVEVDNDGCNGCELCVEVCPGNALEMIDKKAVAMISDSACCIGCGACIAICLPDVISLTRFQQYDGRYRFIGRSEAAEPRKF